jgi:DNA repair protein SbcD/Mre11
MKILCTGDIHIGRRPSRLPSDYEGRRASAARAWETTVEAALDLKVAAVLLAGDVVDQDNKFYEALGPLERGVRRLSSKGIEVFAVAGNHDFDVLPRLARILDDERFHLLGQGGTWEYYPWCRDGRVCLHVDGWSFSSEHVREDPLRGHAPPARDTAPVVGLLHSDVGSSGSPYAPTRLADLRAHPVAIWVVGHVHRPWREEEGAGATVLNTGSPQGLDPGEPGMHAAWLIEIDGPRVVQISPVRVSRVRYDDVEVDLDGVENADDVERRVVDALTGNLEEVADEAGPLERLVLRLRLTGRTPMYGKLAGQAFDDLRFDQGSVRATIESVRDETRPAVDLQELARGNDPVGHLANLLLGLEEGQTAPDAARLLALAQRAVEGVDRSRPYTAIQAVEGGRGVLSGKDAGQRAREALAFQGRRLLDCLLEQRGGQK